MWYGSLMGQITRISTRDYRTEPQFPFGGPSLPKHYTKMGHQTHVEILREHVDLIENDNSVILATSQLLRGTATSGKKWTRWKDVKKEIVSIKPNKAGVMRANYLYKTERGGFKNFTPFPTQYAHLFSGPAYQAICDLIARVAPDRLKNWHEDPRNTLRIFYPAYSFMGITSSPTPLTPRLRVAMREETAMNTALVAFGKRHYRKDLVKSLASSRLTPNIELAILLRSLMKTDWLVEIMRDERPLAYGSAIHPRLNGIEAYFPSVLQHIPEHRRRRFVLSLGENNRTFNTDAIAMGTRMDINVVAGIRTIQEMHEIGVQNMPRIADNVVIRDNVFLTGAKSLEIKLNDRTKKYDGVETEDGLRIVAPKHTDTTDEWSKYMNNCIRMYGHRAAAGDTNLGGVYDGEKLVANFEIDPKGNLLQLLGKYNNHLDISLQGDIIEALEECGSITDRTLNNAWGVDLMTVPRDI